jgi:hypothetical protein
MTKLFLETLGIVALTWTLLGVVTIAAYNAAKALVRSRS